MLRRALEGLCRRKEPRYAVLSGEARGLLRWPRPVPPQRLGAPRASGRDLCHMRRDGFRTPKFSSIALDQIGQFPAYALARPYEQQFERTQRDAKAPGRTGVAHPLDLTKCEGRALAFGEVLERRGDAPPDFPGQEASLCIGISGRSVVGVFEP